MVKTGIAISFQVLFLITATITNGTIETMMITSKKEQLGHFN